MATMLGTGWAFLHSTLRAWATSVVPEARGTAVSCSVAALFIGSALGATLGRARPTTRGSGRSSGWRLPRPSR
ncbi:hypothetical protein ACFXDE_09180 [Kitasatospora sp. NPDC059408]|uniref:hypothetical protein n=1 Tax=Kitasatospora sp. NPDC059408 TaxID=3346823 RepID=UPI00369837A9